MKTISEANAIVINNGIQNNIPLSDMVKGAYFSGRLGDFESVIKMDINTLIDKSGFIMWTRGGFWVERSTSILQMFLYNFKKFQHAI